MKLIKAFGDARDKWIRSDHMDWARANRHYTAVGHALDLAARRHDVYIVTTKQKRFVKLLLRRFLYVNIDEDRILDTHGGKTKAEILRELSEKHPHATRKVFVEDKLKTLLKVSIDEELKDWNLYFATWGYNLPSEVDYVAIDDRIQNINEFELIEVCKEQNIDTVPVSPFNDDEMDPLFLPPQHPYRILATLHAYENIIAGVGTHYDALLTSSSDLFIKSINGMADVRTPLEPEGVNPWALNDPEQRYDEDDELYPAKLAAFSVDAELQNPVTKEDLDKEIDAMDMDDQMFLQELEQELSLGANDEESWAFDDYQRQRMKTIEELEEATNESYESLFKKIEEKIAAEQEEDMDEDQKEAFEEIKTDVLDSWKRNSKTKEVEMRAIEYQRDGPIENPEQRLSQLERMKQIPIWVDASFDPLFASEDDIEFSYKDKPWRDEPIAELTPEDDKAVVYRPETVPEMAEQDDSPDMWAPNFSEVNKKE